MYKRPVIAQVCGGEAVLRVLSWQKIIAFAANARKGEAVAPKRFAADPKILPQLLRPYPLDFD